LKKRIILDLPLLASQFFFLSFILMEGSLYQSMDDILGPGLPNSCYYEDNKTSSLLSLGEFKPPTTTTGYSIFGMDAPQPTTTSTTTSTTTTTTTTISAATTKNETSTTATLQSTATTTRKNEEEETGVGGFAGGSMRKFAESKRKRATLANGQEEGVVGVKGGLLSKGGRNWSQEFFELLERVEQKPFSELWKLSQDFLFAAKTYAQIIVSEVCLPYAHKTIKPIGLGGIAGGEKYHVQGILFKVCFFFSFLSFPFLCNLLLTPN
jgi:hypothetical protein